MNIRVVVHEAEEGGFWAEVPSLPGCVTQAETRDALHANLKEAVSAWLEAGFDEPNSGSAEVLELAL